VNPQNPTAKQTATTRLAAGVAIISAALQTLGLEPGVYRMLNEAGEPLYVGKARQLKKRVAAYTKPEALPNRLRRMIAETARMEFVVCQSEVEALLLESALIKKLLPRYNIRLMDDKAYPYILVRKDHPFPQILRHRGAKTVKGEYYGPFANAAAATDTITALQKVFQLRPCRDTIFNNRSRPCLQYHIKRCSAPCVGYINAADYAGLVGDAERFLRGKNTAVQESLQERMQAASIAQDYEQAAFYRDRLKMLAVVQSAQVVHVPGLEDADVLGIVHSGGATCVQQFFYRAGSHYGNTAHYPKHDAEVPLDEVLSSFIAQFYSAVAAPPVLLTNIEPAEKALLTAALELKSGHRVRIEQPQRGAKVEVIAAAVRNAGEALARRTADSGHTAAMLERMAVVFDLPAAPERIEIYDNSHIQGTSALGAMVVATPDGFDKKSYRIFNMPSAPGAGDDFEMLRLMLRRRLKRSLDADGAGWTRPDVLLIDGGAGQLTAAQEVLSELDLADSLPLIAIAKGVDRNAGREWFHQPGKAPFQLPPDDALLYYLQRLRDEAHRFAITGHRAKRGKTMLDSSLDSIPGVGPKRKKALLAYFGSAKAVKAAGLQDLQRVPGVDAATAEAVWKYYANA
jgi:excinuclease ABC subunit C